jgi:xanthine dehydrogenase accessory factor
VAVVRPTSARPGARGIVHPDGRIEGWVGGSCAQPIVVKEALRSLADGQPRLLRIAKESPADSRRADGVIDYLMTCHSGGTLEIYVEPQLPAPALWVVGTTPIASSLVELGAASGFAVTLVDPLASSEDFPAAERVVTSTDLVGLDPDRSPFVVVASQGSWDEEALASVLRRDVAYVGLVASPTRAVAVRDYLDGEGIPHERIAALRAPAGLDIGAETPAEVALSILTELVQVRRNRAPFVASPGPATLAGTGTASPAAVPHPSSADDGGRVGPAGAAGGAGTGAAHKGPDETAAVASAALARTAPASAALLGQGAADIVLVDPVCGMTVEREHARHLAEHDGVVYAFCCIGCRTRFMRDPTVWVSPSAAPGS